MTGPLADHAQLLVEPQLQDVLEELPQLELEVEQQLDVEHELQTAISSATSVSSRTSKVSTSNEEISALNWVFMCSPPMGGRVSCRHRTQAQLDVEPQEQLVQPQQLDVEQLQHDVVEHAHEVVLVAPSISCEASVMSMTSKVSTSSSLSSRPRVVLVDIRLSFNLWSARRTPVRNAKDPDH